MKPPLTLNLFVGFPSYGGNGGISSECPSVREWFSSLQLELLNLRAAGKIGNVSYSTLADTPISMVRNQFVMLARKAGAHLLLTIDSDMNPNMHAGEPWFEPFFQVAFNEIYDHYQKGPLVVGAPYCGPPSDNGGENVYVFQFENQGWHGDYSRLELSQFTRCEAGKMSGVSEVAALPTGLILYDMRIFEMYEPSSLTKEQVLNKLVAGEMTVTKALDALREGWFYYEWKNQYADEKASTEDVATTRDMALMGMVKLGYNPLRCAWDSWAGHHKPWCVGKPKRTTIEHISAGFRRAVEEDNSVFEVEMDFRHHWRDLENKIHHVSPFPEDFPMELVDGIPDTSVVHFSTHRLFGEDIVRFIHMTSDFHLHRLREILEGESQKLGRKLRVIEIGSWLGDSAIAMAPYCEHLYCIDSWEGSVSDDTSDFKKAVGCTDKLMNIFLWNVRHWKDRITVVNKLSSDAAADFMDDKVDLIFIDADHTYECTREDILSWLPHLMPDGTMIGHDYKTQRFPGVAKAVKEIFGDSVVEYANSEFGSFWLVWEAPRAAAIPIGNGRSAAWTT